MVENNAVISVIVPVYNIEDYISECIESIIHQTYKQLQIILVDDGSTDLSGVICDRYAVQDHRIEVIHKENGGLVSARKAGINAAYGNYVAWVDGDDWIEPVMIEKLYTAAVEQQVDAVICGKFEDFADASREVPQGIPKGRYNKQEMMESVYPHMLINGEFFEWGISPSLCDKLFKREYIEKYQLEVDERIEYCEDAASVYMCMLNLNSIYIMDECLYHYRQRPTSMARKMREYELERKKFEVLFEYMDEQIKKYKQIFDLTEQWEKYATFMMLPRADSLYKGYEELDYLFPFPNVKKGSKIVLYGAGTFGQRLYNILQQTEFCKVVKLADRNYKALRCLGLKVDSPESIAEVEYDYIVVTISFARSRYGAYRQLIQHYDERKICLIDELLLLSSESKRAFGIIRETILQ